MLPNGAFRMAKMAVLSMTVHTYNPSDGDLEVSLGYIRRFCFKIP